MEVFVLFQRGEFIGVYRKFETAEKYLTEDGYVRESQTDSGSMTTYARKHPLGNRRDDWLAEIIKTEVNEE